MVVLDRRTAEDKPTCLILHRRIEHQIWGETEGVGSILLRDQTLNFLVPASAQSKTAVAGVDLLSTNYDGYHGVFRVPVKNRASQKAFENVKRDFAWFRAYKSIDKDRSFAMYLYRTRKSAVLPTYGKYVVREREKKKKNGQREPILLVRSDVDLCKLPMNLGSSAFPNVFDILSLRVRIRAAYWIYLERRIKCKK